MGGQEFYDGSKMATDGNGLDEDWTMVLEMFSQEIVGLKGSCPMLAQQRHKKILTSGFKGSCLTLAQQHHNKHINTEFKGSCLMPSQRHHNKHISRMTSGFCPSHDAQHYLSDPRITLLGGRLSQVPPRRGNHVSEFYDGSCQRLVQQHHNKILNATDSHPGDIK